MTFRESRLQAARLALSRLGTAEVQGNGRMQAHAGRPGAAAGPRQPMTFAGTRGTPEFQLARR